MATPNSTGYDSFSINKYQETLALDPLIYKDFMYGSGWKYGLRYPSPKPENYKLYNTPVGPDGWQITTVTNPTFEWTLPYGEPTEFVYEVQISHNSDMSSPFIDEFPVSANTLTWLLPYYLSLVPDGIYYSYIRTTDGFTWSNWSAILKFGVAAQAPLPPTIDPVITPSPDFCQVITGTKQPNLYVYIRDNGGAWIEVNYTDGLAGTRWWYRMCLDVGVNYIEAVSSFAHSSSGKISRPANATIYLLTLTPELYNIWNCFDEFGLLLSLPRIPGERNREYKARLLDVYTNPANSTYTGLRNGIARELGILPSAITINNLSDLMDKEYSGNLFNTDGNAIGTDLEKYAAEVYENNPIFLGNVVSDESYWDGVDEETNGYVYLPHQWDPNASGIYDKWQCGGIGDQDDLWVNDPVAVWNPGISGYSWYLPIHSGYFYSAYPSGFLLV